MTDALLKERRATMVQRAVIALLERGGDLLLGTMTRGPCPGVRNFPGGKVEDGETPFQALMREVKDEAGLRIRCEDMRFHTLAGIITFFANDEPDYKVWVYRTGVFFDEVRDSEEMTELGWHHRYHLPYKLMLEADSEWVPLALRAKPFRANIFYRERMRGYLGKELLPWKEAA